MIRRYFVFLVLLGLAIAIAASFNRPQLNAARPAAMLEKSAKASQMKFSHKFHIETAGIECASCHPNAATSKLSSDGLASSHDACQSCHEEELTSTCNYCHTEEADKISPSVAAPRDVIFSHQQHLAMKDVDCKTCHAGVDEAEDVSMVALPAMTGCMTCHNEQKATSTCEACHKNFVAFLPDDHKKSDFRKNHRDLARLGELGQSCQTCHTETFCQQCHQSAGLKAFGTRDLMTDPRSKTSTRDGSAQMIQQNIHDLNYKFTHGIDAKSRQAECASCHSQQTFCVQCHETGGNITQVRFKPASHLVAGFTTLGLGSGGGLHAKEAKRDIENCLSCHNVEGQDPTCLTCHTESGRVR
jgi:c(7)-type cytochrome triheme protein